MKRLINEWKPNSYNNLPSKIRLYQGTDIDGLDGILYDGVISASNGRRHGETSGMNWFSTKLTTNYAKGVIYSIVVDKTEFENGTFKFMNECEVVSYDDIPIQDKDLIIEKIGGYTQENFDWILKKCNGDIFEFAKFIYQYNDVLAEYGYNLIDDPICLQILRQTVGDDYLRKEGILENKKRKTIGKKIIRLTESEFHTLIEDTVKKLLLLNEYDKNQNIYQSFQQNQSLRYKIIGTLAKNGYLVHGTTEKFDMFDSAKIKGGSRATIGYGAYFTDAAYKCEEYGNEFVILDAKSFNFLNLEDKVRDNIIFHTNDNNINSPKNYSLDDLKTMLYDLMEKQDNCVNVREYDYYEEQIKFIKKEIDKRKNNGGDMEDNFLMFFNQILNRYLDIDYRNMVIKLINSYSSTVGSKFVSQMFLKAGYDGFKYGSEYAIFNFSKLNKHIVKDKGKLLNNIYNNTDI